MSDLIERNKTITDALTYGTGFIENGKHIPIGDAMKNDLIERLEKKLRFESVETGLVKEVITTLREQELLEQQLSSTAALNVELMERIAELEDERMDVAMLDQYRIWYAEEEAKVKRLDTALARIEDKGGRWSKEVARKARAGE
jgi:signal recognition particle GTPase